MKGQELKGVRAEIHRLKMHWNDFMMYRTVQWCIFASFSGRTHDDMGDFYAFPPTHSRLLRFSWVLFFPLLIWVVMGEEEEEKGMGGYGGMYNESSLSLATKESANTFENILCKKKEI